MTIEFKHFNATATAFIIYNLKQVENAFLLIPVSHKKEFGLMVLINKVKNVWQTESRIGKDFPQTFSNIISEFEKISKMSSHSDMQFLNIKDMILQGGQDESVKNYG